MVGGVSWTFVLRPAERTALSCGLDQALRAGLAAYYLPAMDDWQRLIVRPLAVAAYRQAIGDSEPAVAGIGELVLHRFFAFAAAFDDFESVLANENVWVPVPDPAAPGRDLGTPDRRPIRYSCRLDQLISDDDDDEWWAVEHRFVRDRWADDADLLADIDGPRALWALEVAYPQLYVAGTVNNELLVPAPDEVVPETIDAAALDVPPDGAELDRRDMTRGTRHTNLRRSLLTPEERILAAAIDGPDEIVHRESDGHVRRTWIRRQHGTIHEIGFGLAREAMALLGF